MSAQRNILSIAGLDPSGGAGLLADIEVFSSLGLRSFAVASALTGQNSFGVSACMPVGAKELEAQLRPLLEDFEISAIKIGMLGTAENVRCLARLLQPYAQKTPIVIDPVLCSSSGHVLLESEGQRALLDELMPLSRLVTPNLDELWLLSGIKSDVERAAEVLLGRVPNVLVKGGHAEGEESIERLFSLAPPSLRSGTPLLKPGEGLGVRSFAAPRLALPLGMSTVRGTGCRLSSGVAGYLALGEHLDAAISKAKEDLFKRLRGGAVLVGRGGAGYL